MDKNSLSHTTWECKYHLVFAPKYRRQVIYGQIKADVLPMYYGTSKTAWIMNRGVHGIKKCMV